MPFGMVLQRHGLERSALVSESEVWFWPARLIGHEEKFKFKLYEDKFKFKSTFDRLPLGCLSFMK
jgi:hypothetical protein